MKEIRTLKNKIQQWEESHHERGSVIKHYQLGVEQLHKSNQTIHQQLSNVNTALQESNSAKDMAESKLRTEVDEKARGKRKVEQLETEHLSFKKRVVQLQNENGTTSVALEARSRTAKNAEELAKEIQSAEAHADKWSQEYWKVHGGLITTRLEHRSLNVEQRESARAQVEAAESCARALILENESLRAAAERERTL